MLDLQIKEMSKRFKDNILYEGVNLSVPRGQTVGIVGANGAGKSVLFKLIAGLDYTDAGKIYVRGREVGRNLSFPKDLGLLVNQPGFIEFYDGFSNLKLLAEIQGKIDDEKIRHYMRLIGLNPDDKSRVKTYSSGMKQKLGIVQAIMEDQTIVILDEPFNTLDYQTNAETLRILLSLKKEGKTLLLTSHQHDILEKICDQIYVISNRKIVPFNEELRRSYFSIFSY